MALIDNISTILGFGGAKPEVREGASQSNDIHVQGGSHNSSHTVLEPKGQPTKYVDNLPG